MTIDHARLQPDLVGRHQDGWSQIADQFAEALRGRHTDGIP
jgi:hypothetical protein